MEYDFRPKIAVFCLALLLLALVTASTARADELTGRIRGVVSDPTGAVLAGVKVIATNVNTGISWEVETSSDGSYQFLNLPVGTYKVTATKTGFRGYEAANIALNLNQVYVLNVPLELGRVSEMITVEASTVQVETTSTQLGTVVSGDTIRDMPLNGRNWIQLQQLQPGVVSSSDRFGSNFATNGSETQQNSYLINGVDSNDLPLNTPLVIPSPDAIGEFNLVTNTINPEYGRNSGAILNALIRSGSNSFHGSGFEFYRDTFLNSKNYFKKSPDVFHQNQFGGTIGGPVWKNHTFFFFSYQGTRARQGQVNTSGDTQVLTQAERNGDFSGGTPGCPFAGSSPFPLVDSNGATQPAGTDYCSLWPNGVIPTVNFNSISNTLVSQFVPLPNSGLRDFLFNPVTTNSDDQEIARVDHTFSSHDAIWGYGLWERNPSSDTLPFTGATLPGFPEQAQRHIQQYAVAWNHTFNAETLNEARVGYTRFNFVAVKPVKAVLPSSVGFTGIIPQNPTDAGVPTIAVTGLFTLGFSDNGPQPRIDQTYQFTDNFSKVIGRHTFKAGLEMRRFHVSNPFFFLNNGHFDFGGSGNFSTGVPGADFLLGIPDDYNQSSGGIIDASAQEYYSYVQDQVKVRSNLTLNFGLGWQVDTPLTDHFNHSRAINCFRPGQQSTVFPTAPMGLVFPGDTSCSPAGYDIQWNHIGPRFGIAWSPGSSGKTSFRAGVGLYYNRSEEELTLQNLTAPPFSLFDLGIGDVGGIPSFAAPFVDITGSNSIPNKYPFTPPAAGSAVDFSFFEPMSLNVLDPNFNVPRSLNYNLTFQQELPARMIFSLAYVGAEGRRLLSAFELNPGINPQGCAADPTCVGFRNIQNILFPDNFKYPGNVFGSVGQQATIGTSNYNSLQASVKKSLSHGLDFLAAYTWSHSLDTSSSFENASFGGNGRRGMNPFNLKDGYADSEFDARHRFVVSYSYSFPALQSLNGALRRIVGGWKVVGNTTFQTGFPVPISDTGFRSLTCEAFSFYACPDRPNILVSQVHTVDPRTSSFVNATKGGTTSQTNYWFDPNVFAREDLGTFGNARRSIFHGPSLSNTNLALFKEIAVKEQFRFELRLEAFNIFNHAQFKNPQGNINSGTFGRITQALDPRIVQLGAKLYF